MSTNDVPLQALTVFLIRSDASAKDVLKNAGRTTPNEIDASMTLYIKKPRARPPSWAKFFAGYVDPEHFGTNRSTAAVLLVKTSSRLFAVVFGQGRHLLNLLTVEQTFGLLVTLNTVDPSKVRSIDKASLDRQGIQSRIQASRDATARDFGLDLEQDLVRAVAGMPLAGAPGESVSGFDSLNTVSRIRLPELKAHLAQSLKKSQERIYRRNFAWIDQIREVRVPRLQATLSALLCEQIKSGTRDRCWMAPDGIIDWEQVSYFQFGSGRTAPKWGTLTLDRYLEHLGDARKINVKTLFEGQVRALRADDLLAHTWPSGRCLQAEVEYQQKSYLLSGGKWYEIAKDFVASINEVVGRIPRAHLGLPAYRDLTEGVYNQRVAQASQGRYCLMDADNVVIGGGSGRVEFCDLYSLERDVVHIKRYSGSATLSHLFSQASVSGQSFKTDAAFRQKVDAKLAATHKLKDFRSPLVQDEYRVVIGIVGGPMASAELPFFSRVTLKNCFQQLTGYGYRVATDHIAIDPAHLATSQIAPGVKRLCRKTRR